NCSTDSNIAYKEMEQNFELYSEERFWKKSLFMKKDILGGKERERLHHYIQSFKAGEVSKEEAHRIGLGWAKENLKAEPDELVMREDVQRVDDLVEKLKEKGLSEI
ncbi:MAG: relaxase/mobilization nuclease domain-containing protein, partial [Oscillospiraceae bacterium]